MKQVHDDKILPASMQKELTSEEKYDQSWNVLREKFPRLHEAGKLLWGDPAFDTWINKLILSERHGRAGFPVEVMTALLFLSAEHVKKFDYTKKVSPWELNNKIF